MKKQENLDDLIISDNLNSKNNNNLKNILTIISLVLAVLIGAILLTKTLLEEPQKPKNKIDENLTNSVLIKSDINESNMSNDVNNSIALESNTSISANQEINTSTLKAPISKATVVAPVATDHKVVKKTITKEAIKKPLPVIEKANTKTEIKTEKKDLNKTTTAKTKTNEETKDKNKMTTDKTETKTITENTKKEHIANETYYAQVGSFSTKPNNEFISIIQKNGYNYKIITGQDGSSKLLIGPYNGKEQATMALAKIKDRINKSAFLVKQ